MFPEYLVYPSEEISSSYQTISLLLIFLALLVGTFFIVFQVYWRSRSSHKTLGFYFFKSSQYIDLKNYRGKKNVEAVEIFGSLLSSKMLENLWLNFEEKGTELILKSKDQYFLINDKRLNKAFLRDGDVVSFFDITFTVSDAKNFSRSAIFNYKSRLIHKRNNAEVLPEKVPYLLSSDMKKMKIMLNKNKTYIGKSVSNDVVIQHNQISLRHAMIQRISGSYKIVDLQSPAGTYVNGKKCDEKFLTSGDEVSFDTSKYKFVLP